MEAAKEIKMPENETVMILVTGLDEEERQFRFSRPRNEEPDKELASASASRVKQARFVSHRGAEDQYSDQSENGVCLERPWPFSKRDKLNFLKQMENPTAASAAAIFAANCQQMQSLKGAGTALGQAALIACTSSWLLTLLLILAFVALPSLSYTKAKLVTGLAAFLTASSHFAFVAMNLGPISKYTVGIVLLAASLCSAAILYITCTTEIKSAPAPLEGVSTQ